LGSKHALSNGNEPEELTALISAFEIQDEVKLAITITVLAHNKRPDLMLSATATGRPAENGVAKPSVSASAIRWGSESATMMGAITSLLYALDFQLAEQEWDAAKKPGA